MLIKTIGSICSGIEAASVAWEKYNFNFQWFSEIADFQSKFLSYKYPNIKNLGDMNIIPDLLKENKVKAPDLICGGTPCQAFSLAGWQGGLEDERGNLTLKFVDIVEENDRQRIAQGKEQTVIFWENVEGVLKDKTNAFGCFLASLAGCAEEIKVSKWENAGLIRGKKRNVAWRVMDAKYFGLPQQRRRLYVVAGGKNFNPENVLFEKHENVLPDFPKNALKFEKNGRRFEVFREYTDCLYSSYGTKWNGNAAALNGSLFVAENGRLRRFTPLECERLMGFPDNYTDMENVKPTNRYQGVGNSWAVPVISWIGNNFVNYTKRQLQISESNTPFEKIDTDTILFHFNNNFENENSLFEEISISSSEKPENCVFGNLTDIIEPCFEEKFYISPAGCAGILRRATERHSHLNSRLEIVMTEISSQESKEKIEQISRIQPRGKFSEEYTKKNKAVLFGA